jgi:hypothetical protein
VLPRAVLARLTARAIRESRKLEALIQEIPEDDAADIDALRARSPAA